VRGKSKINNNLGNNGERRECGKKGQVSREFFKIRRTFTPVNSRGNNPMRGRRRFGRLPQQWAVEGRGVRTEYGEEGSKGFKQLFGKKRRLISVDGVNGTRSIGKEMEHGRMVRVREKGGNSISVTN